MVHIYFKVYDDYPTCNILKLVFMNFDGVPSFLIFKKGKALKNG